MDKNKIIMDKNNILSIVLVAVGCFLTAFFLFKLGMISWLVKNILYSALGFILITTTLSIMYKKTVLFRLMVTIILFALFFSVLFLLLEVSGFWDNISTVENLQKFIKDKGMYSGLVFVIIQFLQVVAIPIPGMVTVSVGNILFGPLLGSLLSYIGIILGSVTAFLIGRKFGYKLVIWIAGEENVKKMLNFIKGKDKVMFTVIFLLPFFPDDLLCFVAGLTSMSLLFFTSMAMITRIITIAATSAFTEFAKYLINTASVGGYIILGLIGAAMLFIFIYTLKYGDRIQSFMEYKYNKIFKKKDAGNKDN